MEESKTIVPLFDQEVGKISPIDLTGVEPSNLKVRDIDTTIDTDLLSPLELPKEDEKPGKTKEPERDKKPNDVQAEAAALAAAEMHVLTYDWVLSAVCASISGDDPSKYAMNEGFKDQYTKVTAKFYQIKGEIITVEQYFWGMTVGLFLLSIIPASVTYFKKQKASKKISKNIQKTDLKEPTTAAIDRFSKQRKRFEVDAEGFFERDVAGDYIQKEDRKEKATTEVLEIIKARKKENRTWGEINKELRTYLYSN